MNLLYINASETSHYLLVQDLSRLVSSQYNNNYHKKYFCQYCLHFERCKLHGVQRIKLPEADDKNGHDKIKFRKIEYQVRLPFVIYADFENVLCKQDSCEPSPSKSFTTQYQYHVPCGSCIYVKCSDGQYFEEPQVNIGDDATEMFLDHVLAADTICRQHLTNKISMKRLTQEQLREYNNTTNYSIFTKTFKSTDKKDCDHLTGEYRSPAHNTCNLNYRVDPKKLKIPSIIRNLKGILFLCYSYFHSC